MQSLYMHKVKVAFFQKVGLSFKSPNLPKKIVQKTILDLKFKTPAHNSIMLWAGILNFKFRIVFWNIFFWRFGDLKNESHFLKKSHLNVVPLLKYYLHCFAFLIVYCVAFLIIFCRAFVLVACPILGFIWVWALIPVFRWTFFFILKVGSF